MTKFRVLAANSSASIPVLIHETADYGEAVAIQEQTLAEGDYAMVWIEEVPVDD